MKLISIRSIGGSLLLWGSLAGGQEIGIDAVRIEPGGQFSIDFSAPTSMGPEAFILEGGADLNGDWTILGDSTLSGISAGDWRAATDPSETLALQRFFRVREGGDELGVTPSALEGGDLVVDLTQAYRGLLDYSIEFFDGTAEFDLALASLADAEAAR